MENTLTSLSRAATFIWGQLGEAVDTIINQPLLLIPVGIFVAGAGIGLAKRLIGH